MCAVRNNLTMHRSAV